MSGDTNQAHETQNFVKNFFLVEYINRITDNNKSLGSTLIFITIFTFIFKWILDVLVNGHKVNRN